MKHFGSVLEFTAERNADILRVFRQLCAEVSCIRLPDIAQKLVASPSKRFWVSPSRAAAVCSLIFRGSPVLDTMLPSKRRMFSEIFRRVSAIRAVSPERSLLDIVSEVVEQPAPEFYMEPGSVIIHLSKIRNGWYVRKEKPHSENP